MRIMLRFIPRRSLLVAMVLTALLGGVYYAWNPPTKRPQSHKTVRVEEDDVSLLKAQLNPKVPSPEPLKTFENVSSHSFLDEPVQDEAELEQQQPVCHPLPLKEAVMETADIYPKLNFNAKWIERREYWNEKMERRYRHRRKELWPKLPLKVIIMPHSHNDPGWLKTYEGYFHQATKSILDNAVSKLTKHKNMTFVWTEMAFLSLWWETAHQIERDSLKKLIEEGRFEILTGGWVMTDEANVHLYAMVDQLIEGHQWLLSYLGVRPKSSWSVDPFGHGGTFPYILKTSGVDGMVIMRIHYAWKEFFAVEQSGDFLWQQRWDSSGKGTILCHNFPYDIYSIKGSCGPHAQTCVQYNFAASPGAGYSEYASRMVPINPSNLRERAETILEEYGRTGSLFSHNVVLVPLGDDFLYTSEREWDQQYANYKMIMDFINAHPEEYHAEVRFGTLSDYFKEVNSRTTNFDTLSGDFFVYSDIFTEGVPAYWSGYYTTRPYMKQLSRELENNLRAAEILFTVTYQSAQQKGDATAVTHFSDAYYELVQARRHLALFQHHDAITGTSKQFVMHDYGLKLFDGLIKTRGLQRTAIQYLMAKKETVFDTRYLSSDYERHDFGSQPKPLALDMKSGDQFIVVFNTLANVKYDVISFFAERGQHQSICIEDPKGKKLHYQMNPTWSVSDYFRLDTHMVEIVFTTKLLPLSLNKFKVSFCAKNEATVKSEPTQVFCMRCTANKRKDGDEMIIESIPDGAIVIENAALSLVFDEDTKLLSTITHKATGRVENVQMTFGAYPTMPFRSGAYLFKTDSQRAENIPVFDGETLREVVIVSGTVFSELSLVYEGPRTSSFVHTVRLYHAKKGSPLSSGIYVENNVDFGDQENYRDIDFFMRLKTGIKNGGARGPPTFYTDQNGFQMQKRIKANNISIEGNYFPITSMAYLEDEKSRISLVVDHAQGAASWQQGWLEVMIDRRSSYDDSRGMGEGVLDTRPTSHKYWMLFEPQQQQEQFEAGRQSTATGSTLPSAVAHQLSRYLNYPTIQYVGNIPEHDKLLMSQRQLIAKSFPCDQHLFNLRTLPKLSAPTTPSNEALLILHSQTPDCTLGGSKPLAGCEASIEKSVFTAKDYLDFGTSLRVKHFRRTSLTGNQVESQDDLDQVFNVDPMTLETVKVQF